MRELKIIFFFLSRVTNVYFNNHNVTSQATILSKCYLWFKIYIYVLFSNISLIGSVFGLR